VSPTSTRAATEDDVQVIRFALIGAGLMGRFHGRTLASLVGGRLSVVLDEDLAAAEAVAAWSPGARAGRDVADAFGDDVDAVVVVTPAQTHAAIIEAAARAGKAIFCEKPLATSLADVARVRGAVAAAGVPFQLGFQRRFDPGVARLLRLLAAGELGRVETVRSVTADPHGPDLEGMRRAAGIFHDTLSHDADLALAVGGPVEEVFTCGAAMLDPRFADLGKPDTTVVSLRFESGAIGVIENRLRTGYGYETALEVGGSLGKGVVRDDALDGLALFRVDRFERAHVPWFLERFAAAYRAELEAFVAALQAGRAPAPGVDQGVAVMRLCAAAERSYREGRPVRVDEVAA
jgi:myo-inositol 2-dehydrogenase / D-chiro-inositol 1-dehydrogenase